MKQLLLTLMLIFSTSISYSQNKSSDWSNRQHYAEANEVVEKGVDAVFMGNSITQNWASMRPQFFNNNNFIGRGISGQVSAQMLLRFHDDVVDLAPRCVVIMAGTNDIAQNAWITPLEDIFMFDNPL